MKRNVLNKVLLLRLIELAKHTASHRKIIQMVFILQEEGRKEKRVTFNYEFKKWHFEPYSSELEKDLQQLDLEGLIVKKQGIQLTEKGKKLTYKMLTLYFREKIDSFFKFFTYIHLHETLYETSDFINDKYELAKYPTDATISDILIEVEEEKVCVEELKKEINRKFEEIDNEDIETYISAKKLLSNNKYNE